LENLDALFAAFNNAHVHLDYVARADLWDIGALVLVVDEVGALHEDFL
jgi:hypothetical protein